LEEKKTGDREILACYPDFDHLLPRGERGTKKTRRRPEKNEPTAKKFKGVKIRQ